MAEFNIPIEIPADKVADVIASLQWRHGKVEVPSEEEGVPSTYREMNVTELRAILKTDVVNDLKNCVRRHKKFLVAASANDDIELELPDIT